MAKEHLRNVTTPGNGKTVYIGSDLKNVPYNTESGEMKDVSLSIVYEIIERTSSKKRSDFACSRYRSEHILE